MKSEPSCRICRAAISRVFVDLGMSPFSNSFLRASDLGRMEPFYPLRVFVCEQCLLVQLPVVEKSDTIFGDDYIYFSSYSESWLAHSKQYVDRMIERFALGADSLALELASNDGYLLQYFKAAGVGVLGVEPSASVARVAEAERGIPTEVSFFGVDTAKRLAARGVRASVMTANNVLAHVPDLHDFIGGVPLVLAAEGVLTVEFPHLLRLIQENQFDTIYQEHYSYFSLLTAKRVIEEHGLRVFDVEALPTHGGSLRVYACHASARHASQASVDQVLSEERGAKLDRIDGYLGYAERVNAVKRDLLAFLIQAKREGKRIAGYGAPAKGNTLLNYCGIREDLLEFTVDRSPHKQGTFLPGTHIPVRAPDALAELRPDYVLVLPWNLRNEIVAQVPVGSWGGRFVVAIPKLEVFD